MASLRIVASRTFGGVTRRSLAPSSTTCEYLGIIKRCKASNAKLPAFCGSSVGISKQKRSALMITRENWAATTCVVVSHHVEIYMTFGYRVNRVHIVQLIAIRTRTKSFRQ